MKLVRPISAILLLFSLSLGLFALQRGGYQGYGRQQYYSAGRTCPRSFIGAGCSTIPAMLAAAATAFAAFAAAGRRIIPRPTTIA